MNPFQQMLRAASVRWMPSRIQPVSGHTVASFLSRPAPQGEAEQFAQSQQEVERLRTESRARAACVASAIHDLRQPLQALMLHTEALAGESCPEARARQIHQLRQSVVLMDRLCAELLETAVLEVRAPVEAHRPVALAGVFDEVQRTLAPTARAQGLRLIVRPSALQVRGDPLMLTRIFNNLVCNAVRATRKGGVLIGARRRGAEIRVDVCDTGRGIAAQHQKLVFEPFYQVPDAEGSSRTTGYGLGLATVQHLVQLHGGRLRLRSRPERGTTLSVYLPCA